MVLDYLIKFKHFSFSNFCQIQKILVIAFLIENGKMVNSLNSLNNYFGKQQWFWTTYLNSNTFYFKFLSDSKNIS